MRKVYLLVHAQSLGTPGEVSEILDKMPAVLNWRTDMPNSFYIVSKESAQELHREFILHMPRAAYFLFTEIGENKQGVLPKETWSLLNEKRVQPSVEEFGRASLMIYETKRSFSHKEGLNEAVEICKILSRRGVEISPGMLKATIKESRRRLARTESPVKDPQWMDKLEDLEMQAERLARLEKEINARYPILERLGPDSPRTIELRIEILRKFDGDPKFRERIQKLHVESADAYDFVSELEAAARTAKRHGGETSAIIRQWRKIVRANAEKRSEGKD